MSNAMTIDHARDIQPMPASHVLTPLEMLGSAIERGADPALLEKLMALSERYEATQARKAFDAAMADAKAHMGTVHKTTKGNYGMYADFASVARLVDPVLSEHGLSYRFKVNQNDKGMQVTCVVRHRDGHSEETSLMSPVDTSGSKNAVQQIGSTQTYLQRYTLMAALGLAASKDDDGHGASPTASGPISPEQAETLRKALHFNDRTEEQFCKFKRVERLEDIPARDFETSLAAIKGAKK